VTKFPLDDDPPTAEPIELRFYRDLASKVPFKTPRCLYQAVDPETGRWVLVLEDLRGLRAVGDVRGVPAGCTELIVRSLAAFHACFWDRVDGLHWVRDSRARIPLYEEWIEQKHQASTAQLATLLPNDRAHIARKAAGEFGRAVRSLDRDPRTLVHLDYRADNMLIDHEGHLWLLDFESMSRFRGPVDLATFVGTSLSHGVRRAYAPRLLRLYLEELRRHGVADYGADDVLRDTRLGLIRWLAYAVALLPEPEVSGGRLRRILECWIDRLTFAVQELDAFSALG
jgi:hypothetical protein